MRRTALTATIALAFAGLPATASAHRSTHRHHHHDVPSALARREHPVRHGAHKADSPNPPAWTQWYLPEEECGEETYMQLTAAQRVECATGAATLEQLAAEATLPPLTEAGAEAEGVTLPESVPGGAPSESSEPEP